MTDFFMASPAERRATLLTFRDRDVHDQWQTAALSVADAAWGWGWWHDDEVLWEMRAAEVRSFANRRKHCWIPASLSSRLGNAASWADEQRDDYRFADILSSRQISCLEGIPNWEWDVDAAWDRNLTAFDQFTNREGHGFVPRTHVEGASSLGVWVMAVRHALARQELPAPFAADIAARPEWESKQRVGFDYTLTVLAQFVAREGHARVPVAHVESLVNLGQWVNGQRNDYTAGILSDERIAALEAVDGWAWLVQPRRTSEQIEAEAAERAGRPTHDERLNAGFARKLALLVQYVEREGHTLVPNAHVEDDVKLGQWAQSQRSQCKAGTLTAPRIAALEAVAGWAWRTEYRRIGVAPFTFDGADIADTLF